MKTGTLILLAAVGLGGYLFLKSQAAKTKTPPPSTDDGKPWWETLLLDFGDWVDHQNDGAGNGNG